MTGRSPCCGAEYSAVLLTYPAQYRCSRCGGSVREVDKLRRDEADEERRIRDIVQDELRKVKGL